MTDRKVISLGNLPAKPPVLFAMSSAALLKAFDLPGWCWGALGAVVVFLFAAFIFALFHTTPTDIFEEKATR